MKAYIVFEKDNVRREIFLMGYDSGGGYFIKDLSSGEGSYLVLRLKYKHKGYGIHKVPKDHAEEWVTKHKPKLTCHFDGSCHISGSNIRSGYYKTNKKPKGVGTKTQRFNDGGPICGLACWNLEQFPITKKRVVDSVVLKEKDMHKDPHLKTVSKLQHDAYIFEIFYFPKNAMKCLNLADSTIRFQHPIFGNITLKYIPTPQNHPGFFAVGHRLTRTDFKSPYGLTYGGGVTQSDEKGFGTQIQIIFPYEKNFGRRGAMNPKNLNFTWRARLLSRFDDLVSDLWNRLK